ADEHDACLGAGLGKSGILRQEAIARMDRLGTRAFGRVDDPVGHQITLACRRSADMDRLVSHGDVPRLAVGIGIDRDGLDAQAPCRLDDPAGDLAAVGDQDLGKHQATHFGLRLSRKARMPSSASSVTHWLATCSPKMSAALESCGRALIWVTSFFTRVCTEG